MKKNIVFAVVVFLIPMVTIVYLVASGAAVVIAHNTGANDTSVSGLIVNISTGSIERTDRRTLKANGYAKLIFFPHTQGSLFLDCASAGHSTDFPLGAVEPNDFTVSVVTVDSCDRLVRKRGFGF